METTHVCVRCDDIKRMVAVIPEYIKRLEKVEERQGATDKTVNELVASHAETKIYVKLILDNINKLENNMLGYVKQAMTDATKERIEDKKVEQVNLNAQSLERIEATSGGRELIKYIVGGTIIALIAGVVTVAIMYAKFKFGG